MPRWMYLLFGVICLAVGAGLIVAAVWLGMNELRWEDEREPIQGQIVGREIESDPESDDEYIVVYRFSTLDGVTVEGRRSVDEDVWDGYVEGQSIALEYIPGDPSINRVAGQSDWVGPIVTGALGGTSLPVGLVLTAIGVRRTLRHRQLMRGGIPTQATVVGQEQTGYAVNDVNQWVLLYQYADARGVTHTGRSEHMSPDAVQWWPPGSVGTVRYDAVRPDQSVWVGQG